ncbi:amidohydrolase [Halalkalibacillus sediminis]|uniref:Amidohydrolase n=1 Tax=Halalkalibacillus sediminis TaxID=2018042 RepID=A0A2I0QYK7_9BACI|nr:amidohydrolase [Halalkalibacillus sediminis]
MGKLFHGNKIYTMAEEGHSVEAVFTENGKIVSTGTLQDLKSTYQDRITEEIEVDGVMLPGFIDSHMHIIGHGERLIRLDLGNIETREEVLTAVEKAASGLTDGEWLIGEGFNENYWDDPVVIHRKELDERSPNHPVMLSRVCRHALVVNTKAMEIAGVDDKSEDIPGGVIGRDQTGELDGSFFDQAQELIKEAMPSVSQNYLERAIETSIDDLLKYGIVGGHSEDLSYYGGFKHTFDAFKQVITRQKNFRAHLLVHHDAVDEFYKEGYEATVKDDWLEFGAMKIFVDGALGGRTALLSRPYKDDPETRGVAIHSDEVLEQLVIKARSMGMAVAVHAIGDEAVEKIVDMIERHPVPSGQNDRIIHAQIMRPELIERMKKLQVIIDVQPTFVASDFPWVIDRVGEDLIRTSYPWKTYIEAGIICAGGSDAPIEHINPLEGIDAAVNRRSSFDGKPYGLEQCLSVFEAIELYTVKPAEVIRKSDEQGRIREGHFADFVILDQDPFEVDSLDLHKIKVTRTIVGEEIVYSK